VAFLTSEPFSSVLSTQTCLRRVNVSEVHRHRVGRELAVLDVQVWQCLQRPNVEALVVSCGRTIDPRADSRCKVVEFLNRIGREQSLGELAEVKPLIRRPLEGAIVQIEAVNIEVDDCHGSPRNSTLHAGIRACRLAKETPPAPWWAGSEADPQGSASVFVGPS
jgi:hypothetical protein